MQPKLALGITNCVSPDQTFGSLHAGKFFIIFFVISRYFFKLIYKNSVFIQIMPHVFFLPDLGPNCLQRSSAEDTSS